jgi:hypothetical protein
MPEHHHGVKTRFGVLGHHNINAKPVAIFDSAISGGVTIKLSKLGGVLHDGSKRKEYPQF